MIVAGIVAGGKGTRMGGTSLPKQFVRIGGRPVIIYTIEAFLRCRRIDYVIIGINSQWESLMEELIDTFLPQEKERICITPGGDDRNETVEHIIRCAGEQLCADEQTIILTHDAVRPFVTEKIILDCIDAMAHCRICTAAIPATDTVVLSKDQHNVDAFPKRSTVFQVQTPQTFRLGDFEKIYQRLSPEEKAVATDVCRLFDARGIKVALVEGHVMNIKLTYPSDLSIAEEYLRSGIQ